MVLLFQSGTFNRRIKLSEESKQDELKKPELQDHHKAAILKAFDVATRNSNENAVQFGTILGECLVILGLARNSE